MNISGVGLTSLSSPISKIKPYGKSNFNNTFGGADRISISNEAMEACIASKTSASKFQDAELESTLTNCFNGISGIAGMGRSMPSRVQGKNRSSWSPENLESYRQLVAEVSAKKNEKHNVLNSLGDKMVVADKVMKKPIAIFEKSYSDLKDKKRWVELDDPQSILSSASEPSNQTSHSNATSKSMYSMLLESLFIAELEESGAIGGNGPRLDGSERQSSEDKIVSSQPNKTKSINPLKDGDKVIQIKKVLTDFTKGKADLADISSAIGGGGKGTTNTSLHGGHND